MHAVGMPAFVSRLLGRDRNSNTSEAASTPAATAPTMTPDLVGSGGGARPEFTDLYHKKSNSPQETARLNRQAAKNEPGMASSLRSVGTLHGHGVIGGEEGNRPGYDAGGGSNNRKEWEFEPTPEHRSLILLLYRHLLKGLLDYKSIRRRTMMAYARMITRRRAKATEKLLVDECVEETRRAIYVLEKHRSFSETREYFFDSMTLPKDTGQDVKTFMEEVYDPEISKQEFAHIQDIVPGKEQYSNQQGLGPAGSAKGKVAADEAANGTGATGTGAKEKFSYRNMIKDEDKAMRPPPPPTG